MKVTCLTSIRAIAIAVPFVMAGGLQANAATTLEELAVAAEADGRAITW